MEFCECILGESTDETTLIELHNSSKIRNNNIYIIYVDN